MAAKSRWAAFPHDATGYAYPGEALRKAWPKLHAGDREPWPDAKRAAALLQAAGKAAPKRDADALAADLQEAWRAFHRAARRSIASTSAATSCAGRGGSSGFGAFRPSWPSSVSIHARTRRPWSTCASRDISSVHASGPPV